MKDNITRRDFLNGTQIALGSSLISPWQSVFGSSSQPFQHDSNYYPPKLTGLRGSHDGSWEVMHSRVLGKKWPQAEYEEKYDLVVVGAGISGLSAALLTKKITPPQRY
jgi:spermidine dehydrogenase